MQSKTINQQPTLTVTENSSKPNDEDQIHIGKRGGKYRLDANGKKIYINKRAAWQAIADLNHLKLIFYNIQYLAFFLIFKDLSKNKNINLASQDCNNYAP